MRKKRSKSGFTLVEVVISLTIVALLTAIIFSMLRLSYSSTKKGERVILENQLARVSYATIARQISSYYPYPVKPDDAKRRKVHFFTGSANEIYFTTSYSITFGSDAGVVFTGYKVRKDADNMHGLEVMELFITDESIFNAYFTNDEAMIKEILSRSTKTKVDVLKRDTNFKFRYYDKSDSEWKDNWDSRQKQNAPQAVGLFDVSDMNTVVDEEPYMVIPVYAASAVFGSI